MNNAIGDLDTQPLTLLDELMLMLLNEQNGYFHQIPGWELNCAVTGAAIAELSFQSRIDTDMEALLIVDPTETGIPALDLILKDIVNEPVQHNAQYWIERLVVYAEPIIDLTLDHLVDLGILEHHDGEFWTLASGKLPEGMYGASQEIDSNQFIKHRIREAIFADAIPDPRDVIIICLIQTCDVFRFIFELDDKTEERIKFICKMDLIARSLADAVEQNIANPMMGRSHLTKQIPKISLPRLLRNRNFRKGNVPAVLGDLAKEYGPVFLA
ncbi:MAG: GPP34 family phosphoprotein, partial [Gammaproteobacteria bacterium]|nr:GPP34 family phosphoprotein [Gammaproteobacteria bacterium]